MNPWKSLRELPKELWIIFTTTLVNRTGTMALPFLVLYLTRNLNFSSDEAAWVFIGYGIGALISAPFAGRLSDFIGHRKVMLLSLFLSSAVMMAYPLAESFEVVFGATVMWAMMSEAFRPSSLAVITDLTHPEQRKSAYALQRLAINIGMSIGPAVGGFLVLVSYTTLFVVNGMFALVAGFVLLFSPWKVVVSRETISGSHHHEGNVINDKRLLYFLMSVVPVIMVFFQHESSMPLYLVNDLHLHESAYGILFTVNTALIIIAEVWLNLKMSHWKHNHTLVLGAILVGLGFGAMIIASDMWTVALTVVIWTFGEMILFPGLAAYMGEIAPPNRRGEYMGYYQMTFSLAFILGPWIGIQIYEHWGSSVLWISMLGLGIVSSGMLSRIQSNQ